MPMNRQMLLEMFNKPLLMNWQSAQVLFRSVGHQLSAGKLISDEGEQDLDNAPIIRAKNAGLIGFNRSESKPYAMKDSIAVIPVNGSLIHKLGYIGSWWSGYDAIKRLFDFAMEDPDVKGILLDIDSPGGMVSGCFDLADYIYESRGDKPIWSLTNDMACSAAMAIASAADRRLVTQTGTMGSVGVVMAHVSYEDILKESGLEITLIHSGEHKVDGNPYTNLPDAIYQQFKTECDDLRQLFAGKVARNIGMTEEAVLATEALCYSGQHAIDIGFASEVVNSHSALEIFSQHLSRAGSSTTQGVTMTTQATTELPEVQATDNVEQEAAPSATDQKARFKSILKAPEAEGKANLAEHLAYNTDMSAEDAVQVLAAASKEQEPNLMASGLDSAMSTTEQPNLSADSEVGADEADEVNSMLAAHSKATGQKIGAN